MGLLADDFFRLAHDDTTGGLRVHERAVGWGLAGALLAELLYGRRIGVHDGEVYVVWRTGPPADPVTRTIFEQMVAERPIVHSVRTWLTFLSEHAYRQVQGRLHRGGHLCRQSSRFLFVTWSTSYLPVDVKTAAWPAVRLAMGLRQRTLLPELDVVLAGLAAATGLEEWLIRDADNRDWARSYLRHLLTSLPAPPRDLVAHTRAAVGNALVTHHT